MKEKTLAKTKRILYAMLMGEKITPLDANRIGNTTDGTRKIRYLRTKYPIRSEKVKGEPYHVYWIDEDFIQSLKKDNKGAFIDSALAMANI